MPKKIFAKAEAEAEPTDPRRTNRPRADAPIGGRINLKAPARLLRLERHNAGCKEATTAEKGENHVPGLQVRPTLYIYEWTKQ